MHKVPRLTGSWQYFMKKETYLVHDPNNSLRTGDVVAITPGWRSSQHKRHVVKHILSPYGSPIEDRPPIPTEEERIAAKEAKRAAKRERRAARKEAELIDKKNPSPQDTSASSREVESSKDVDCFYMYADSRWYRV